MGGAVREMSRRAARRWRRPRRRIPADRQRMTAGQKQRAAGVSVSVSVSPGLGAPHRQHADSARHIVSIARRWKPQRDYRLEPIAWRASIEHPLWRAGPLAHLPGQLRECAGGRCAYGSCTGVVRAEPSS